MIFMMIYLVVFVTATVSQIHLGRLVVTIQLHQLKMDCSHQVAPATVLTEMSLSHMSINLIQRPNLKK